MALRLDDRWVWDFWLARDGDEHHIFYLQAPRALVDPARRHHHATIGHAVSRDLTHWQARPDALGPGAPGSWDDLAVWTGSTIRHAGRWHMLFTGISRTERGLVQRVGVAVSDDLERWTRVVDHPVLEADPRWYETLDLSRWRDQSWRDPYVFEHPDGLFHALLCARSPRGPADGAGVVGHARSPDLLHWEVLPPLTEVGEFAQAEVPQLTHIDGRYALLVSCHAADHSRLRRSRLGAGGPGGTYLMDGATPLGPFAPAGADPLTPADGSLYAGKIVQVAEDGWRLLAFRGGEDDTFLGELTDPLPVSVNGHGARLIGAPRGADERDPRLAPRVAALVEWGEAAGRRHRGLTAAERRRRVVEEQNAYLTGLGMEVTPVAAIHDHRVTVADGQIAVRVFSPDRDGPHPALVHLHGGGFVLGTIDSLVNDAKCSHVCHHAGCVVATVEYRLAPESRFPVAVEDCYAALEFIADNAAVLGVDPARIAVGGESAGGNLAAAVARLARDRNGPALVLQLLEVPVCDLRDSASQWPSATAFARGYGLDADDMTFFAEQYLADPRHAECGLATPLATDDLRALAPAHVMTAEYDVLRDGGEAYAAGLAAAGVPVTLQRMLGHTHGSPVLWPAWSGSADWMRSVVAALSRAFQTDRRHP